ncbi:hypothetical protein JRI60_46680 [Archangium violaceum]|uniref:AMIN-like domain-containing (lipo)protein n=1 Tax=Archangium violaceum TaxID=83451 RepID=UPI00194FE34C|nr:hypothetical protein [Archangium violaceum]QRN96420.1 hypothetical protein JRI60_46680 [Archangium violaceum]
MKVFGRWMPVLGLAACLATAGCKKEEPAAARPEPTSPAEPTPSGTKAPENTPPPPEPAAPAGQPANAGAGAPEDAGAAPAPTPSGSQAGQAEDPKGREWTASRMDIKRSGQAPVTLREVRAARNEGFDRVVFQFDGDQVPGYHVEYVDKPVIKCGSGDPTELAGQGWLQVRIQPAQAHADGKATVTERERKPALPVLAELEQTCDFEGEVTWVLGVQHPNKYRVMELHGPTRLVVDVQH